MTLRSWLRRALPFVLVATLSAAAAASWFSHKKKFPPPREFPGVSFPPSIDALSAPLPSTAAVSTSAVPWYPEYLVFEVNYGPLTAGRATLEMDEQDTLAGRPAFHIVSRATSNSFVDTFYKVRDLNESWLDADRLDSLGYGKHLHEGGYVEDTYALFDQARHRFVFQKTRPDRPVFRSTGTVPEDVQDVFSAFYYLRTKDLQVGHDVVVDVNSDGNWPLLIKVLRKETVKVPFGKFHCVVVQPVLRKPGLFIQKGKDLYVWLTDDARKMPVKMEVEIFIGHVSAKLISAGKGPA